MMMMMMIILLYSPVQGRWQLLQIWIYSVPMHQTRVWNHFKHDAGSLASLLDARYRRCSNRWISECIMKWREKLSIICWLLNTRMVAKRIGRRAPGVRAETKKEEGARILIVTILIKRSITLDSITTRLWILPDGFESINRSSGRGNN